MGRLLEGRVEEVFGDSGGDGVGVFLHEGAAFFPFDLAEAGVVAELHAVVGVAMVHDVGFEENGGGVVKTIGEEVAGVEGTGVVDVQRGGGGDVVVGDEIGLAQERRRTWFWREGGRVG